MVSGCTVLDRSTITSHQVSSAFNPSRVGESRSYFGGEHLPVSGGRQHGVIPYDC